MAYSVKRGPFANREFSTRRQYRNAVKYYQQTGNIPLTESEAIGYLSAYEKQKKLAKKVITLGMTEQDYFAQRQYFATRAGQYEAIIADDEGRQHLQTDVLAHINLLPKSHFSKLWDDAVMHNFSGDAMERLMLYAGMRDTAGRHKTDKEWETYVKLITWFAQHEPSGFTREPWRELPRTRKGRWIYPWSKK